MSALEIPLPNDELAGGIVIASTWVRDEDPVFCLVMVLNPSRPYYTVSDYDWDGGTGWVRNEGTVKDFPNINPATAHYADSGGDY